MNDTPSNSNLIVYRKALEAASIVLQMTRRVPAPLKSIADQAIRSASSVPANIAEGSGRFGRDRTYHYRVAYASAKEVDSHLQLLCFGGAIPRDQAGVASKLFDDTRAMIWRLIHPKT